MKKIITLLFVVFVFLFVSCNVYATQKVNPSSGSYQIKRLEEKIILLFKFSSQAKVDYYKVLLDKRLEELVYVVNSKDLANIEKTSQRYETTAGQLTEFILTKNLGSQKELLIKIFERHSKEIEKLRGVFVFDTGERRLVENDINSLKIYSSKLK